MTDTLFVTDLDGTLLQPDVSVSDQTRSILTDLLGEGLLLTVATARTSFTVMPLLESIPLRLPLILQNGSVLHDPVRNKIVDAAGIPQNAYLAVCELYRRYGFNGFVFCVPGDELRCCYTALSTPHMLRYYQARHDRFGKPFFQVGSMEALASECPVYMSLNAPKPVLDPLREEVKQIAGIIVAYYQDVYEPDIWYLEISAPEASKFHGVRKVQEMTGAVHVTGFGDNRNDFPLFDACDTKIAVGNAAEVLKERADLIIGSNTENAVAEYLQKVFHGGVI